jgi:hypothetical protein
MKKLIFLIAFVLVAYASQAQIAKGEKFLGGSLTAVSSAGFDQVNIIPEFKYALSDKGMIGVSAGVSSVQNNTSFVIGPNYTWIFNIEGNLFWLLTGYGQFTFGDRDDFSIGAFPGLGYRIHDRILLGLTNGGVYYSTELEGVALNAGLNGLALRAYIRLGK